MVTTLPQVDGGWFLTDGGIETTLIYHEGIELPEFAAFVLLDSAAGRQTLRRYYERYLGIAADAPGAGFILESPTWRAGLDWGRKLGYDDRAMQRFNVDGVDLMHELRKAWAPRSSEGRGDGPPRRKLSVRSGIVGSASINTGRWSWSRRAGVAATSFR